jgi:hypothetical protein
MAAAIAFPLICFFSPSFFIFSFCYLDLDDAAAIIPNMTAATPTAPTMISVWLLTLPPLPIIVMATVGELMAAKPFVMLPGYKTRN